MTPGTVGLVRVSVWCGNSGPLCQARGTEDSNEMAPTGSSSRRWRLLQTKVPLDQAEVPLDTTIPGADRVVLPHVGTEAPKVGYTLGLKRAADWRPLRKILMFCSLEELHTESDVEQKLLWPLLTTGVPNGAGLVSADVLTKLSIRRLEIGKGSSRKLYYPDYMVVIAGLPVLVIEAKAPGESVDQALAEARRYATELNALFPSGINPCTRIVACNGAEIQSAPVDTADPDIKLKHSEISVGSALYAQLIDKCRRSVLQKHADEIRTRFRKTQYRRAVSYVGGPAFQNEELAPNTFGATIVGDYGHVFSPRTRDERTLIVREAYVPSLRRQRYLEPIDRLIRTAVMPTTARLPALENTSVPTELVSALRERRNLENQVLLLIGSVGSGKSTFIDYASLVALPRELRERTVWARLNLNEAPLSAELAYGWISKAITNELKTAIPDEDVDDLATLEKIFRPELNAKNVVRSVCLTLLRSSTRLASPMNLSSCSATILSSPRVSRDIFAADLRNCWSSF